MDYIYDGTFEGLLCALYNYYQRKDSSGIFPRDSYQVSLINSYQEIITQESIANKMYRKIRNKLTLSALKSIYYCYLSDIFKKENIIINFLDLGIEMGPSVNNYHSHPAVNSIISIERKVSMESHRYLGYVRFTQIKNILYSSIHPTYNILPLIGNHFADRLSCESFIIQDDNRKIALVSKDKNWLICPFDQDLSIYKEPDIYVSLWKEYFDNIAIESRINKKLQQSFVPLKYRKDLLEFT